MVLHGNFSGGAWLLKACNERIGLPAQKPYSGKLMLRVDPEIHSNVARAAYVQGKSINQWAAEVLGKAAQI